MSGSGADLKNSILKINCRRNKLTSIDISGMQKLEILYADDNNLSSIIGAEQMSSYKGLRWIFLDNNDLGTDVLSTLLRSLPDKTGGNSGTFDFSDNPGLVIYDENGEPIDNFSDEYQEILPIYRVRDNKNWRMRY